MLSHAPGARVRMEEVGEAIYQKVAFNMNGEIHFTRRNKNREIIGKSKVPFRSFLGNFGYFMYNALTQVDTKASMKDTSGSAPGTAVHEIDVKAGASTTDSAPEYEDFGIMIGCLGSDGTLTTNTSIDPRIVHINDYNLHQPCTAADVDFTATTMTVSTDESQLTIARTFQNKTGRTLYIQETGLGGETLWGAADVSVLLARDISEKGSTIYEELVDDSYLDVEYKFTLPLVKEGAGYTANFIQLLYANLGNQSATFDDTTHTSYSGSTTNATDKYLLATTTTDTYGILVGRGVSPNALTGRPMTRPVQPEQIVSIADRDAPAPPPITVSPVLQRYNLTSQLSNSSITHSAVSGIELSTLQGDGGEYFSFGVFRDFTNPSSSASVRVKEYGIFMNHGTGSKNIMLYYDSLVNGQKVVSPNKILRIYFEFLFQVNNSNPIPPAIDPT